MDNIKLNELNSEELTNMLIYNPEIINDVLQDSSKFEELLKILIHIGNPQVLKHIISEITQNNESNLDELSKLLADQKKYNPKDPYVCAVSHEITTKQAKFTLEYFRKKYEKVRNDVTAAREAWEKYIGHNIK